MTKTDDLFRDDYNLDALHRIQPQGHAFEMLVTPRFRSHYTQHRYEPLTAALIRSISSRKKVFIDVGAHYGFFSILAGRRNPDLEIHALEPVPESFEVLRRNLELNGLESVHCHPQAASDKSETATFLRSIAADNSSFYAHPQAPPLERIEVETLPLSRLLQRHRDVPTLIKIDTDGHEVPILEDLRNSLSPTQDASLVVEFNPVMQEQAGRDPAELLALLGDMKLAVFRLQDDPFRLIRIDPASPWRPWIGPEEYANLYCRPQESALSLCLFSHSAALAGAERSLAELVGQLVEDHGAVCNVVIPGDGPLRSQIETVGAGVITTGYGWWCGDEPIDQVEAHQALGDDLARLLVQTVPQVDAVGPDLVCTNSLVIPFGAIAASLLRLPHIWNAHEYGQKDHGYDFYLPFEQVLEFVRDFSDFIFGPSRALLHELFPDLGEDHSDHLYPAIEAAIPPAESESQSDRTRSAPVRLLDLSTLTRGKQQEIAIRAVAELGARGLQATLLLKGPQDATYVSFLQELVESLDLGDRVTIEGYSGNVWPAIDRADVIVISAPSHAFGRVAVEGMLGAKPVVYPRHSAIGEYLEDGLTGLSYIAGDAAAMAEQIERLIRDPELGRRIGGRALTAAQQLFSRQESGGKFMARALQIKHQGPGGRPGLPSALVSSLLTGIQRLDRQRSAVEAALQSSRRDLAATRQIVAAREDELRVLKPLTEARDREIDSLKREIAAHESVLAARNEEIAALKPELNARDEAIAVLEPILAARDEAIAVLEPILAARDVEITALKPILAAREEEIENLRQALDLQTRESHQLRARLTETEERLGRIQESRFGRLALRITRKK